MAHTLVGIFLAGDLAVAAFVLLAALAWLRLLLLEGGPPEAGTGRPGAAELVAGAQRYAKLSSMAFGLVVVASVLGITQLLPPVVPGAMCGRGVMQALGSRGSRALAEETLAAVLLTVFWVANAMHRRAPHCVRVSTPARAFLAAVPLLLLAAWDSGWSLAWIGEASPVDCCGRLPQENASPGGSDLTWTVTRVASWAAGLSAPAVLAMALAVRCVRRSVPPASRLGWWLGVGAGGWSLAASWALGRDLPLPLGLGVRSHCAWCLFREERGFVGYLLWGMLLVVAIQAVAILTAAAVARHAPGANAFGEVCVRQAAGRIAIALAALLGAHALGSVGWSQ